MRRAVEPHLPARGPVQPAEQVQQRRLPAAARPHHRHRLARGDVEIDAVDGAHQRFAVAVAPFQRLGRARRSFTSVPSSKSSSARTPRASAGPPAAAARCPPATAPAIEPPPSAIAARCASATRRSSSRRCASTSRTGSASPAAAAATSLRWNSARSGFGQLTSASHSATRARPSGGQRVHLAVGPIRLTHPLRAHQPGLLQPGQRHVDLARVHRLAERAERELEPRAQLVAVRRLLGQHRQHDFLHDAQLVAGSGLLHCNVNSLGHHRQLLL